MILHIILDSYPLGLLATPGRSTLAKPVITWVTNCLAAGHEIYVPEVIDYELRRELLRARKSNSVLELDGIRTRFNFVPINSAAILLAADLWAKSRQTGLPTGDPKKIDIDVILAAQALTLGVPANALVVATSNVRHLANFVSAKLWSDIAP